MSSKHGLATEGESLSGTGADLIEAIDAVAVELEMPWPFHHYTVVRVRTTDGIEGNAFSLSLSAPVAAAVESLLAPVLLGRPADAIAAAWDTAYRATVAHGRVGIVMRALSLIDIALWDIKGKRAGLPVWRLLGGHDPQVPCVLLAGGRTGASPEEHGEHVADLATRGHPLLKIGTLPVVDDLRRLLATAARGLPDGSRLVVDAHWTWRSAIEAGAEIRQWADQAPLAWVEDPLVPEDIDGYARLAATRIAPIGVGDNLTDRHAARALLERTGIDVLRIDAMAIGGVTGAWHVSHLAEAAGVPVSFHLYPETHVHLAAAGAARGCVETFGGGDSGFVPPPSLLTGGPIFQPGMAVAPETPGLGFQLDEELITARGNQGGRG